MEQKNIYNAIGIMSGTSLDGLDIAACQFVCHQNAWTYKIIIAKTYKYDRVWKQKLTDSIYMKGFELIQLDKHFGTYIGKKVNSFLQKSSFKPDFIASHGHTVFHQPDKGITYQIGSGEYVAKEVGIPVIFDFRSLDVALGGQGAPLVPIGDELLFHDFDYCLNLGGFSNISFNENGKRLAFDICPVNIVVNKLCPPFDENGKIGKSGRMNYDLFHDLNGIAYYSQSYPKSLGKEWLDKEFFPVLDHYNISVADKVRTVYEHISHQITKVVNPQMEGKVLVTGGGTHNNFLIDLIQLKLKSKLVVPNKNLIDFKEALIFAFLGVLKLRNENNCLASVTGASRDCSGGVIINI